MRTLRTSAACFAIGGFLLLVACDAGGSGGDETAADTAANPFGIPHDTDDHPDSIVPPGPISASDGCALVEEASLEAAIGFDVVVNDNTTGNCVATPASGAPNDPTIDFRIEPRTSAFDYFSAQSNASPIANLGERAVWATLNETTGYVVTVSGGQSIVVGIGKADGVTAESRRQAEAVARLLLNP